ncbi:MAG: hypothetical protein PVF78_12700, partial [Desulfobacterales bacterium]
KLSAGFVQFAAAHRNPFNYNFTARFARGAKFAEIIFFSFAAETPANENHQRTLRLCGGK